MSREKEQRNDEKNVMKADLRKFIVAQRYCEDKKLHLSKSETFIKLYFIQINRYKDEEKKVRRKMKKLMKAARAEKVHFNTNINILGAAWRP